MLEMNISTVKVSQKDEKVARIAIRPTHACRVVGWLTPCLVIVLSYSTS